jgi:hypothetical protein
LKVKRASVSNSDAVFVGWQQRYSGEVFALYNITAASHSWRGSTVSEKTLIELNLQVPKQQHTKGKQNIS